jgi:hypothetical protein
MKLLRALFNCVRGRHQWNGRRSPIRTLYWCENCGKTVTER